MEVYRKRLDGFGFNAIVVDGHDIEELCKAFHEANVTKDKPTAIIAKTFKGKFFPNIEDADNWHGKPLGDNADAVIKYLNGLIQNKGALSIAPQKPLKGSCGSLILIPINQFLQIDFEFLINFNFLFV